jgi:hypothetical protein
LFPLFPFAELTRIPALTKPFRTCNIIVLAQLACRENGQMQEPGKLRSEVWRKGRYMLFLRFILMCDWDQREPSGKTTE